MLKDMLASLQVVQSRSQGFSFVQCSERAESGQVAIFFWGPLHFSLPGFVIMWSQLFTLSEGTSNLNLQVVLTSGSLAGFLCAVTGMVISP